MNRESERKRLVELTNKHLREELGMNLHTDILEKFADHLLDNGIVVPPCKVGDILYCINFDTRKIIERVVTQVRYHQSKNKTEKIQVFYTSSELFNTQDLISIDELGVSIFKTKEEAEKMLKGSKNNG